MNAEEATHLLVIFEPPGPSDTAAELKPVLDFLTHNTTFKPARHCKIKTMVHSVKTDTTLFALLTMGMLAWLDDDREFGSSMERVGINAPSGEYEYFQAAWALPGNEEAKKADRLQRVKIAAAVQEAGDDVMAHLPEILAKSTKRWWQFWR